MERKSNMAVILSVAALAFAVAAHFVFGQYWTKLILDILLFGASVIVAVTWAPAAMVAIRDGAREAGDKIVLTVWLSWSALLVQRIYALIASSLRGDDGQIPNWLTSSPASIVVGTLILIAGTYASYATVSDPHVHIREQRFVFFVTFVSGLIVGCTLAIAIFYNLHF